MTSSVSAGGTGRALRTLALSTGTLWAALLGSTGVAGAAPTDHAAPSTPGVVHAPLHLLRGHLGHPGVSSHATSGTTDGPSISSNWSGQVATGGTYSGVHGTWTVPSVPTNAGNTYSASWIGIDGTTAPSLIQTGTAQQSVNGLATYYAWWEALPNQEIPISGTVQPGDSVTASVAEVTTNTWKIVLSDTTQAWTFTKQMAYTTPGASAEWIEEAPTVGGQQSTLADYGTTTFTNVGVTGAGTSSAVYSPVYMADPEFTEIVSWPTVYDPATSSFTVNYGSPTPSITSVSPASGPTSGDTVVTISGQNLFAAANIYFGSKLTTDAIEHANGTITVASPAGSAGTVDIRLTSADTASALVPADHFTYSAGAAKVSHGYWLVGADGGIFTFGAAGFHGSTGNLVLQRPVVGITPTADRKGYWLVATDGGVFAFGDAGFYGSLPGLGIAPAGSGRAPSLNAPIVGMVPSTDDRGYFMVAADGGVFAFGDAAFEGSCPGIGGCSGAAVSVLPDASGHGYWLVTTNGHVYTFGDAKAKGQPLDYTDGEPIGVPVTSAVRTPDGFGYWILLADGIAFEFGDAGAFQAPDGTYDAFGEVTPSDPASAIFATDDMLGYWIAAANGAVFGFGSAPNDGSMAGQHLNAPIIAATGW